LQWTSLVGQAAGHPAAFAIVILYAVVWPIFDRTHLGYDAMRQVDGLRDMMSGPRIRFQVGRRNKQLFPGFVNGNTPGEIQRMAYIVKAMDYEGDAISTTKLALAVAIKWGSQGRSGIKIIGEGHIYTAKELARQIIEKE
jgi:hypothetical protein